MVILLHIAIALTSIVQTTFLLFSPTQKKLTASYVLLAGTIGSGTYLIVTTPTHMLQTCVEGLVYIGFVVGGIVAAKMRLAKQEIEV